MWAMNDTDKKWFWIGGLLRLISDLSEVCSSLVVKVISILALAVTPLIRYLGLNDIRDGILQ